MDLGLNGKRVLIVGGSQGVGKEISIGLAREGARVGVVAWDEDGVNDVVRSMGGENDGHWGIVKDMVQTEAPSELIQWLKDTSREVDILVHNLGGTLGIKDPFCSISDWKRVWRLNLEIAIEINSSIIPTMVRRKWGRVIHISSIAATLNHGSLPYASVKAALNEYVKNLGATVAKEGVTVTAIMPGAIYYEGGKWDITKSENPGKVQDFLENHIAIGRFAKPREISEFVIYLASEHASFFAGSVLPVDGGSR